jgi:hypothetical protein
MKIITLKITSKMAKISEITEKSIFLLVILALIWQCFPRVTSLAQTITPNDLITVQISTSTEKLPIEEQMIMIIKEIALQEDFKNVDLVIAIARAESRLNPGIRGEQDKRDRGLFQINSHFNKAVTDDCAFDPVCATRWTINELKAGHAWKWNASRYKWGKYAYNR